MELLFLLVEVEIGADFIRVYLQHHCGGNPVHVVVVLILGAWHLPRIVLVTVVCLTVLVVLQHHLFLNTHGFLHFLPVLLVDLDIDHQFVDYHH